MADVTVEFGAQDVGLEKTLKSVQTEMADLTGKITKTGLAGEELQSTMRKIAQLENTEKRLKAMGGEASSASPKVEELGKDLEKMGTRGHEAGEKSGTSLSKIGLAAGVAGVAVKAGMMLAEGAMKAATAVADGFGQAIELGGQLTDLSSRTGESAGSLLVLQKAFTNTGVSADSVGTSLNKMQKFMVEAANGGATQTEAMAKLGISMSDLQGKTPTEQMAVFAQSISSIQDPAQRAEAAMSIFGKSGGELLPILSNFSDETKQAKEQLGSLPGVMDRSAGAFDAVGDNMDAIGKKVMEFAAGFLEQALPALNAFTAALSGIDAAGWGEAAMSTIVKISDTLIGAFKDPLGAIETWGVASENMWRMLGNGLLNGAMTFIDFIGNAFQSKLPSAIGAYITSGLVDSALTFDRYLIEALMTFSSGLSTLPGLEGLGQKILSGLSGFNDEIIAQQTENLGKTKAAAEQVVARFGEAAAQTKVFKEDFFNAEDSSARMKEKFDSLEASGKATRESLMDAMAPAQEGAKKVTTELNTQLDTTAKIKASKQEELEFELAMAIAKGKGNKEEIESLTKKKDWLDAWKKAIAAGMGEEQAAAFANNLAAAKTNADNLKPPAFTTAKEDAQAMENALGGSKSFLEAMGKIEKVKSVEDAKLDARAARAEIEAFGQYMNVDLKGLSIPDLAKKLGVRDLSLTGTEQLKQIIDFVAESKDKLAVNPIDSEAFNSTWQGIQDKLTGKPTKINIETPPLTVNTDAAAAKIGALSAPISVNVDANQFQEAVGSMQAEITNSFTGGMGGEGGIGGQGGQGGAGGNAEFSQDTMINAIMEGVNDIKNFVSTLVDKLPTPALV